MSPGRIAIVSGRPNSGKTAYLHAILERARLLGRSTAGLLSHGLWSGGEKTGFELEIVASGERRVLAGTNLAGTETIRYGRFVFDVRIFAIAIDALERSVGDGIVVVDEFGPLEVAGGGLWPGIEFLLRHHRGCLLISVRPALVHVLLDRIHAYAVVE